MPDFAQRMQGITGSAIRDLFKLTARPGIISFGGGNPAASSFDNEYLAELSRELLLENGKTILQYGMTEGYPPLRETMLSRLNASGVSVQDENLLITTGSMQGVEFAAKVLLNPGDVVLVEAPSFLGALQTLMTYQAKLVPVEMDESGIDIDDLERKLKAHRPKLLYTIPTFQNPTGRTLPLERRKRIAQLAAEHDVIVIEDDPYCELRYSGEALPSIKSFDTAQNVLLMNSFSKTISPGLRVGLCAGRADIIRKMVIVKQSGDTHTSNLSQALVNAYISSERYAVHISEICADYSARLECMLKSMAEFFPKTAEFTRPQGGLFLWVTLPAGVDATAILLKAVERGVAYIPGEHFFAGTEPQKNTARFNFSGCKLEDIQRGVAILGELFAQL